MYYLFPTKQGLDKSKLLITNDSSFSMTTPGDNAELITIIRNSGLTPNNDSRTITEICAHVGGDTIGFASYFSNVVAYEMSKLCCKALENNLSVYGITEKVTLKCKPFIYSDIEHINTDIVYIDPPWGGVSYKKNKSMHLKLGDDLVFDIVKEIINKTNVILKLPTNHVLPDDMKYTRHYLGKNKKVMILVIHKI